VLARRWAVSRRIHNGRAEDIEERSSLVARVRVGQGRMGWMCGVVVWVWGVGVGGWGGGWGGGGGCGVGVGGVGWGWV